MLKAAAAAVASNAQSNGQPSSEQPMRRLTVEADGQQQQQQQRQYEEAEEDGDDDDDALSDAVIAMFVDKVGALSRERADRLAHSLADKQRFSIRLSLTLTAPLPCLSLSFCSACVCA